MIMQVIFFVIVLVTLVHGDCDFQAADSKKLREKLEKGKLYNRTFTLSSNTSKYFIGICALPDQSKDNGAVIQVENNVTTVLGKLDQVNLAGGDDWILLTYENGALYNNTCGNKTRSVTIMFVCGKNKDGYKVVQEHTTNDNHCNYVFEFQGYGMCSLVPPAKKKMSGVGIFFIIVLCLASAYLIAGFFFMRIKRGARGIDQIPNLDFWRRLGNLSADGCDYCCRCNRNTSRTGYFDESTPDMRGDDDILAP